jgi:hypothetical protein
MIPRDLRIEIIKQLNNGFSVPAIMKNTGGTESTIKRIKKTLKEEKIDIVETAEVLTTTAEHLGDLEKKYKFDIGKYSEILNKAVKVSKKADEIQSMLSNGVGGLLKANLTAAAAFSGKVLEDIKNNTIDGLDIAQMVAINNNAPKAGAEFLEKASEAIINEQEQDKQKQFDFDDENISIDEATRLYRDSINN